MPRRVTPKKRPRRAWEKYELAVRAIYEALLKQDKVETLEIKQNVKLKGKSADKHQIDVYWRVRMADQTYETIVSVKKWRGKARLMELLTFRGVLDDLPGQPKGIFVSQGGYQRGAIKYAAREGIALVEVVPVERARFSVPAMSVIHMKLVPDKLMMKATIKTPSLDKMKIISTPAWTKANTDLLRKVKIKPENIKFRGADGSERADLADTFRRDLDAAKAGDKFSVSLKFPPDTLLFGVEVEDATGESHPHAEPIPISAFEAEVQVSVSETRGPFAIDNYAMYLLRDSAEGKERYVAVDGGDLPKAIVNLQFKSRTS